MMNSGSADEQAAWAMRSTWEKLSCIVAYEEAFELFLAQELEGMKFDVAGLNKALRLGIEFRDIWPHRVPTVWELVLADRRGVLQRAIDDINAEWRRSNNGQ